MSVSVESPVSSSIDRGKDLAYGAVGVRSPREMVVAWFLIGAFVIITSSIGLFGTLLLLPLVFVGLAIALLRFIPVVETYWPLT